MSASESIGVKSWLANKGITIEGFLPKMLREFDGDSFVSKSRFDAYAASESPFLN